MEVTGGRSEIQGHRLGKQGDSYLLGNGIANDDVAFWDVPGHSGRVGSEVSVSHIHRRGRSVWGCQGVNRLRGFTPHSDPDRPSLLSSSSLTCSHKTQVTAGQQEDCGTQIWGKRHPDGDPEGSES